jgi:hypothetical protein
MLDGNPIRQRGIALEGDSKRTALERFTEEKDLVEVQC